MSAAASRTGPRLSLEQRLKERIAREGPISVHDYMEACLSDPDAGYYRARQPIGATGDFITAPEISQVFGELIGVWCIAVWQQMGSPEAVHLVELGPGRGTLMADLLRAARIVPAFRSAARVSLIEQSEALVAVQRDRLDGQGVDIVWRDRIEDVPPGPAIVIANEFLDALPVRQFVMTDDGWRERCVGIEGGHFAYVVGNDTVTPPGAPTHAEQGAIFETRPAADALVEQLAMRATHHPTAALFIDYGYTTTAIGDTLQAVRNHAYADSLDAPGETDLTAHVDFAALARAATASGLAATPVISQNQFLRGLGLMERLAKLCASADERQRKQLMSGAMRLIDPDQMGTLFKCIALTSPGLPAPPLWGAT